MDVLVDHDLPSPFAVDPFVNIRTVDRGTGPRFRLYRRTIASPPGIPIFLEGVHDSHIAEIALQLPSNLAASSLIYLETDIKAPGVSKQELWTIRSRAGLLQISPR
jgi:hypothetical protein